MRSRTWQSKTITAVALAAAAAASIALLAGDDRGRVLAANTLLLSCSVAVASTMLGAPLAFLLARTDILARRTMGVLLVALVFTPLYLQAAAWQAGFGLQGWATACFGGWVLLDGWRGAIIVHTLAAIPWVVLIVGVALRLAEPELEDAALLDATPWAVFRRVTLRRAGQGVAAAFLWVAVTTAGEMTVTDLFVVRTYAEQLCTEFALGDTLDAAPWKVAPSLLAISWALAAGLLLTGRLAPPDRFPTQRAMRRFRLGKWRAPVSLLAIAAIGLLFGVPLVNLIAKAGTIATRDDGRLARHWSASQCLEMVIDSPARFSRELGWSLLIGLLAASTVIAIGLPLAWSARRGGWRSAPAWLTVAIALAVPGPLVGLGLIGVFAAADWPPLIWLYDRSIAAIWLAQTVRALPLGLLVLWYAMATVPSEMLHAASMEGASAVTRLFRIVVPQRFAALAVAWLVAFAIAWGELAASILVAPPGVTTLPIGIFGLIHYGVDDRVSGVSLFLMAAICGLAIATAILAKKAERHE